jgi:hypothetical protein
MFTVLKRRRDLLTELGKLRVCLGTGQCPILHA